MSSCPTTEPTQAALRRRDEFLPHNGPLSRRVIAQLRRYLAGEREGTDANRAADRELAAAELMAAGHTFRSGDESIYNLTKEGFERKAELLPPVGLREAADQRAIARQSRQASSRSGERRFFVVPTVT
jgi:hypothetical protein